MFQTFNLKCQTLKLIEKIVFLCFSNNSSPTFNFDYFERLIFNYCKQTNFYWCRLIKVLKIDRKEVFNPFWWWCHFPYYLSISARSVSVLSKSIYFSHTSVFLLCTSEKRRFSVSVACFHTNFCGQKWDTENLEEQMNKLVNISDVHILWPDESRCEVKVIILQDEPLFLGH